MNITVLGISLGNIYGSLEKGVGVTIDLYLASGEIKLYLKNGNEVWIHYDVKVKFDGEYQGDKEIFSW